jgi:biotin carboxyl carrier protein
MKYNISVNDQKFEIEIKDIKESIAQVNVNGQPFDVLIENYNDIKTGSTASVPVTPHVAEPAAVKTTSTSPKPVPPSPRSTAPVIARMETPSPAPKKVQVAGEIVAPIPGRIMDIKVKVGDQVSKGQTVATMEAMKMENNIASTMDGTVQELLVQKDSEVATGEVIMIIG